MNRNQKQLVLLAVLIILALIPWVAPQLYLRFVNLAGWLEVLFLVGIPLLIPAAAVTFLLLKFKRDEKGPTAR